MTKNDKATLIMEETERMIDDEGVFSPDQIRYLQVMLQQISRAITCVSNELDQRSVGKVDTAGWLDKEGIYHEW